MKNYRHGLGAALRHNQVAYAYSVTITAAFGVLAKERGAPSVAECFLYVLGAGIAFAAINTAMTGRFSKGLPDEPTEVVALGTALSVFSMAAALGVVLLIAWGLGGWLPWLLGAAAGSLTFILGAGAEMGIAGARHDAGGPE